MCLFNEPNSHSCQYTDCPVCGLRSCRTQQHYKICSCFRDSYNPYARESKWKVLSRDIYNEISVEKYGAPTKRQNTGLIIYKPAQVKCARCGSCVCFDAYNEYSRFTEAENFEPRRANLYIESIKKQALLLYWIRMRAPDVPDDLPNDVLGIILSYVTKGDPL